MGLISGMEAMLSARRIKSGGTEKLSIAQITNLIINIPDSQKNLSKEKFEEVYNLYHELQKCKTKLPLDYQGYLKTAIDIIRRFDKIAPYERYSGGNELEFSFLMNDIRNDKI